ncbi:Small heat shock protein HSP [Senna tora]|uniref:Small heat shock protein HSP n=1 Tax=Senna tora TaxID=362788 RepID=A0A834TLI6_9FABA|nr:Small heat shock protein HSP [Senna tora]
MFAIPPLFLPAHSINLPGFLVVLELRAKGGELDGASEANGGGVFSSLIPSPERESFHRAGGTAWGVGLLLVALLFMISYRSSFQERWFPLLTR